MSKPETTFLFNDEKSANASKHFAGLEQIPFRSPGIEPMVDEAEFNNTIDVP